MNHTTHVIDVQALIAPPVTPPDTLQTSLVELWDGTFTEADVQTDHHTFWYERNERRYRVLPLNGVWKLYRNLDARPTEDEEQAPTPPTTMRLLSSRGKSYQTYQVVAEEPNSTSAIAYRDTPKTLNTRPIELMNDKWTDVLSYLDEHAAEIVAMLSEMKAEVSA